MKLLNTLLAVALTSFAANAFAKSGVSAAEVKIVTQYFQNRFPSVNGPDAKIPVQLGSLGFNSLLQELAAQGFATPKAPSTVEWSIGQLGCGQNNTPRCFARALSYAAALDSRIQD